MKKLIGNSVIKELIYNNYSQHESIRKMPFQTKAISFFDKISSFLISINCINFRLG